MQERRKEMRDNGQGRMERGEERRENGEEMKEKEEKTKNLTIPLHLVHRKPE